ncbi:MAG TPA: helix-turn-helix transcriptional regulator [Pseudonocardiaceae bacterium]|nr:helix-turn-helix transcriptional regulator [Pseudonocardiaceae bacterium]
MAVNRGGEARELGAELRQLRDRAGKTMRTLAEEINASAANVSNWERAERLISEQRLIQLLDALNASDDERERLLGLRRQAVGPGQLVAGTPSIGAQLTRLIEHEQVAQRITDVAPLIIPGLLQTGDYARAIFGEMRDLDTRVALRLGRRDVLTRTRQPAALVAYIDTEVLVRPIAAPPVMADQLHHLLDMGSRPNVDIRLVSSTTPGYHPMLAGPFMLLQFPTAAPIVHFEHHTASALLWEEADVAEFVSAADQIDQIAMTSARSAEVIRELVNGMETT